MGTCLSDRRQGPQILRSGSQRILWPFIERVARLMFLVTNNQIMKPKLSNESKPGFIW